MRHAITFGLLGAALAAPAVAQQAPPVEADLRCIAALSAITGNLPEGTQRLQMAAGVMYFVGRIDGAVSSIDLKAELKRIVPNLTIQQISDETKRCAGILTTKGTQLQEIGKDLQAAK